MNNMPTFACMIPACIQDPKGTKNSHPYLNFHP